MLTGLPSRGMTCAGHCVRRFAFRRTDSPRRVQLPVCSCPVGSIDGGTRVWWRWRSPPARRRSSSAAIAPTRRSTPRRRASSGRGSWDNAVHGVRALTLDLPAARHAAAASRTGTSREAHARKEEHLLAAQGYAPSGRDVPGRHARRRRDVRGGARVPEPMAEAGARSAVRLTALATYQSLRRAVSGFAARTSTPARQSNAFRSGSRRRTT